MRDRELHPRLAWACSQGHFYPHVSHSRGIILQGDERRGEERKTGGRGVEAGREVKEGRKKGKGKDICHAGMREEGRK